MNVPGLSGTSGERQAQLYNKLGAPMGGYRGTYNQNVWLWNQIQKKNFGDTPKSTPATPESSIPTPTARTPWESVLPYNKVFDPNLVNELAVSQISPDIERARYSGVRDLNRGLASSGAYRTGLANEQRQGLNDSYTRKLNEDVSAFTGNINDWATQWYNQQRKNYWQNPSSFVMPKLPSFSEFSATPRIGNDNFTLMNQ